MSFYLFPNREDAGEYTEKEMDTINEQVEKAKKYQKETNIENMRIVEIKKKYEYFPKEMCSPLIPGVMCGIEMEKAEMAIKYETLIRRLFKYIDDKNEDNEGFYIRTRKIILKQGKKIKILSEAVQDRQFEVVVVTLILGMIGLMMSIMTVIYTDYMNLLKKIDRKKEIMGIGCISDI